MSFAALQDILQPCLVAFSQPQLLRESEALYVTVFRVFTHRNPDFNPASISPSLFYNCAEFPNSLSFMGVMMPD